MSRPLKSWRGDELYKAFPSDYFTLWTPGALMVGRSPLGREITKAGLKLSAMRGAGRYGSAMGILSDGSTGKCFEKTGIQGPAKWTIAALFMPPSSPDFAIAGYADAQGSGTQDRTMVVGTAGHLHGYLFDGASKTASTAGFVTTGINLGVLRCDGATMFLRLNDEEVTVAVSNGGYTGYNTGTCGLEGFYGDTIFGGGYSPVARAGGIIALGFYRRCLSNGEVVSLMVNPWRQRKAAEVRDFASSISAILRRRQIIN